MEAKSGVFIVSRKKRAIQKVEAPKVVKRDKSQRSFLFYGRENGQSVRIPGPTSANIEIKDLFRGHKYDEPMSWMNDYEVVLTEIGYVLIGADVRRGIATGLHEYPVYWYDSLASAREDYQISSISMLEKKEGNDGKADGTGAGRSLNERKGFGNFKDADSIIEALFNQERDVITEENTNRANAV